MGGKLKDSVGVLNMRPMIESFQPWDMMLIDTVGLRATDLNWWPGRSACLLVRAWGWAWGGLCVCLGA